MIQARPDGTSHRAVMAGDDLQRWAGWCAYASGVVSIFGVLFLIIFFAGVDLFGPLNDAAVVVQYALMLPIATWVGVRQRQQGIRRSQLVMAIGLAGMLAVIVLQLMLIVGLIPFSRQIGPVSIAFLVVLVWFVASGRLAKNDDLLASGPIRLIAAGLYVGYPFWALALGRRVLQEIRDGTDTRFTEVRD